MNAMERQMARVVGRKSDTTKRSDMLARVGPFRIQMLRTDSMRSGVD